MRVQFSSIFPTLFFICVALLPLSRPPFHGFEILLAGVLAIFFVNAHAWRDMRSVQLTIKVSLLIIFLTVLSAVLATPRGDWLYIIHFSLVILSLPAAIFLVHRHSIALFSLLFIGILLLHAQWGILQFILQGDLGLSSIGESVIAPAEPAVAKFSLGGQAIIRSYGPYLHANTFGGVMLVALVWLAYLAYEKILSARHIFFGASWLILLAAVLLSFSRSAYAGVILLGVSMLFFFRVRLGQVSFLSLIIILTFFPLLQARFVDEKDQAVAERRRGYEWWSAVLGEFPAWQGTGPGQYSRALESYLQEQHISHEKWEAAPVHAVPLLILAQWGLFLSSVAAFLALFSFLPRRRRNSLGRLSLWLVPLVPALLLDHYFLTQSAPFLYIMVTGLSLSAIH